MKTSTQSLALVSGVVLSALRGAEGVATRYTQYEDSACEVENGLLVVSFGVGVFEEPYMLGDFNECVVGNGTGTSYISVCNVDDAGGEAGLNFYSDETCTAITVETATKASCTETVPAADCTEGTFTCATMTECTADVASTIAQNAYNIRAIEYEDGNCTTPTGADGDTVVLSSDALGGVLADGNCVQPVEGFGYMLSECREDGSAFSQTFAPDDATCEGEVWSEATTPTDWSGACRAVEIDGLFYSYVSCTMDDITVGATAAAPTTAPTGTSDAPSAGERGVQFTVGPTQFGDTAAPSSASDRAIPIESEDPETDGAAAGASTGFSLVAAVVLSCAAGILSIVAV